MAKYCMRCGVKLPLLNFHRLTDGGLCKDCLEELGLLKKESDDMFYGLHGTYEMLLAQAKLQDPESITRKPGERDSEDIVEVTPVSNVRSISQILEEDYLVENPGIRLESGEQCFYKGGLTASAKVTSTYLKSGGEYKGISIGLGHGLRYNIGGRTPKQYVTKQETKSAHAEVYFTSKKLVITIHNSPYSAAYWAIDEIKWNLKSFDVTAGGETFNLSTKITPIEKIETIYKLIQLANYEKRLNARTEKKETPKRGKTKSSDSETVSLIREYKQLLDDGIITQEEFDTKKKELLKIK